MLELSKFKLWSKDDLLSKLDGQMKKFAECYVDEVDKGHQKVSKTWLNWCSRHKSVKVTSFDIPNGILPPNLVASLYDSKVSSRGPDDKLYNASPELRQHVARGNTVMYLNDMEQNEVTHDAIIFALRKFTGGMGDEDETQPDSEQTWQTYFLKPLSTCHEVVCTEKANGEAAHLAVRHVKDRFLLCLGSKNVHMVVSTRSDVSKYTDSRFMVAKTVAESTLDMLASMQEADLEMLLNFLHHTKATGVFEVLQPHYQHVVDLSYLESSSLRFITWSCVYREEKKATAESYSLRPDAAIDFARRLGMKTVDYEVVHVEDAEKRMDKVRKDYGYEGEVFYFVDSKSNVIGLLKKKTAWYILARAVREKAAACCAAYNKNPTGYSQSVHVKKTENRLDQIQTWLGFSEEYKKRWNALAAGYINWIVSRAQKGKCENARGNFPQMWNLYLKETKQTDRIEWT